MTASSAEDAANGAEAEVPMTKLNEVETPFVENEVYAPLKNERSALITSDLDKSFGGGGGGEVLWGRRIARFLSCRNQSLEMAWAYFENITLPRRMSDGRGGYTKAPPGAKGEGTTLYPAWTTPREELRDFGTGLAVYFDTMRALIFICFIAGVLYVPTFMFYRSEEYASVGQDAWAGSLRGSLICPETEWVACPKCTSQQWKYGGDRFATDGNLIFVLKNACSRVRWQEGVNHLVVLLFLLLAILYLGRYQTRSELLYDEAVLSASDYSIKVDNPPPDATDPEEWKNFFSSTFGADVVYVCVALDNEELVKALVEHKVVVQKLRYKKSDRPDEIPNAATPSSPVESKTLIAVEEKCRELLQKEYVTSAVFVTFETEKAQRHVLDALSVGKHDLIRNNTSAVDPSYLFRGKYLLDVVESVEPSSVRWQDLDDSLTKRLLQRAVTSLVTAGIVVVGFFIVQKAYRTNVTLSAYVIALLNILVPIILKVINRYEAHPDEGQYQASLYRKITFFRWINTALVTTMITPFTSTIAAGRGGLITAVHAVLKAEIITQPVVHMCDFVGNIKRHILAPCASNQDAMNAYFRGSNQLLGEKYTNMTKIIFLCFFYSVIFPASFFFGAVALCAVYATDKFLLMRSWGPLPQIGDDVAKISRKYFFPATLVVLAVMSEFYFSAYPFDNICGTVDTVGQDAYKDYVGTHSAVLASDESTTITVTLTEGKDKVYRFCDQDFLQRLPSLLNFFEEDRDDWMSDDQQWLTYVYGILTVAVITITCLSTCFRFLLPEFQSIFGDIYNTEEKDSGKRFSDQERISAYVPQVRHRNFSYPLIACDIHGINQAHIGWADPLRDYDFYNMSLDAANLSGKRPSSSPVLSVVNYWPPQCASMQGSLATTGYGSLGSGSKGKHQT